jgi:hypothetical protein
MCFTVFNFYNKKGWDNLRLFTNSKFYRK